jgi:hypothetical protein
LHPGLGIGGIETMQVQLRAVAGGGVHGPYASPDNPAKTIESSLCNPPPRRLTRPYRTEYKEVLAGDTSTFAIPGPAPRLHAISACRQRAFRRPRVLFCNPRVGCRSAPGVTHALRRTVARYVPGMALAPGAPVLRMRLRPGPLGRLVVGAVVRIVGALAPLPVAFARPLAAWLGAVGLGRVLGTPPKRLAATATAGPVAHLFHRSAGCLAVEVCPDAPQVRSGWGLLG